MPLQGSTTEIRLARILTGLAALTLGAMGLTAIVTGFVHEHTDKLGGAVLVLHGLPAMIYGVSLIALGLSTLALWQHTKRTALTMGHGVAWRLGGIAGGRMAKSRMK